MAADPWHYLRPQLAAGYLDMFDSGITSGITLSAPRRMGKTEFLKHDLAPAAEQRGYVPIYCSVWREQTAPQEAIIDALQRTLYELTKKGPIKKFFTAEVKKISAAGSGLEFGEAPSAPVASTELLKMDQLLDDLVQAAKKKKVLLLLDEIQFLATDRSFIPLAAALRTSLDIRKDTVKVVFTGSSQTGLRKMFADSRAPFYRSSTRIDFPILTRDYVEHTLRVFKKSTGRALDADKAWEVFERFHNDPTSFRDLMKWLWRTISSDLEAGYAAVRQELAEENDYLTKWSDLKDQDKEVFLMVARRESPFAKEHVDRIATKLGKKMTTSSIRNSLLRLMEGDLIGQGTAQGEYWIEDENFLDWVKTSFPNA